MADILDEWVDGVSRLRCVLVSDPDNATGHRILLRVNGGMVDRMKAFDFMASRIRQLKHHQPAAEAAREE